MSNAPLIAAIVMGGLLATAIAWQILEIGKERARDEEGSSNAELSQELSRLGERVSVLERRQGK